MLQFTSSQGLAEASLNHQGLRAAFDDAMPGSDWGGAASTSVLVGLLELEHWQPWLSDAGNLIDAVERGRIERRRFATDREELTLCYALHRLLLGKVLGCDAGDVPIGRDALGCPRLASGPLHTSLSHARGCVALAVTGAGPVGIDIESAERAALMPEIAGRVCHSTDAAVLAGFIGASWNAQLLALWVRKEALLKAAGIGLARDMNTFALPEDGVLQLSSPEGSLTRVQLLEIGPDWMAAVAAPPGAAVKMAWLRPCGGDRQH